MKTSGSIAFSALLAPICLAAGGVVLPPPLESPDEGIAAVECFVSTIDGDQADRVFWSARDFRSHLFLPAEDLGAPVRDLIVEDSPTAIPEFLMLVPEGGFGPFAAGEVIRVYPYCFIEQEADWVEEASLVRAPLTLLGWDIVTYEIGEDALR